MDLAESIREAFGDHEEALGVILVRGVPNYPEYRKDLLIITSDLVRLPAESLAKLEDPVSKYMVGWSHGKEVMNGKQDFEKGACEHASQLYQKAHIPHQNR